MLFLFKQSGFSSARGGTLRLIAIFLIAACAYSTGAIATFNEVNAGYQPSDVQILSREGELLHRLRVDASVRRGQ